MDSRNRGQKTSGLGYVLIKASNPGEKQEFFIGDWAALSF
jgi:hypothetical protein